jgi:hypothetical protein
MILGPRGDGKTYGAKKKVIKDAINKGDLFIYLRRYREELSLSARTFFADIDHEFPDYDFRVRGSSAEMAPISTRDEKKRVWQEIGYFIALSRAQQYKSTAFPKVKTIIFDEFIIEKGAVQYIANEPEVVKNFYNTVDRSKDKTRIFMLANAVRITNPHFIEYNIDPDKADELGFIKRFVPEIKNPYMVIQFIDDEEYVAGVKRTAFGRFISGTAYEDYAVGNEFSDNHKNLIQAKPPRAIYLFSIESSKGTFAIWMDKKTVRYYATAKRPGNEKMFTIVPEQMSEEKTLSTFNDKHMSMLRTAFRHGRLFADRASTRNAFVEIFKR